MTAVEARSSVGVIPEGAVGNRWFVHGLARACARRTTHASCTCICSITGSHQPRASTSRGEVIPGRHIRPMDGTEKERGSAYRHKAGDDALRAYRLNRMTRKFTMVISAENAELLAGLLGSDGDDEEGAA